MVGRALLVVLAASLTAGERAAVTPPESIKAELIDFEHLRRASLLTYALVMELGSR